jgi:hypothetical protein
MAGLAACPAAPRPAARAAGSDLLTETGRSLVALDLAQVQLTDLVDGAVLGYRAARRHGRRLDSSSNADAVHDWRKRVQTHWRQMALLRDVWPGEFEARAKLAQSLSAQLGKDHDLALLRQWLHRAERELIGLNRARKTGLEVLIELWQRELRADSFRLADRLFAERPRAFARRLEVYARAADRGSRRDQDRAFDPPRLCD